MFKLSKIFSNKKFIFISFFVLLIIVFFCPAISQAGGVDVGMEYGEATGLSSTDPRIILARIIQIFLGFLGIVAVGLIIYGGFLWMTSAGNEERIEKAKKILKNTVIGLIIVLSAFAIATFVLNKLLEAAGTGGGEYGPGGGGGGGGIGVLGACVVESVYPEPNQKDVPRNTSIIVTFKEEIDSASICNDGGNGRCEGENILTDGRIKIYKTKDGEGNFLTDVLVYDTTDRKTFVFAPSTFLGSPSEYFWYTVSLSNDITKADGDNVFDDCRSDFLEWQFEVSNRLDLTPPQIKENGVFPPPDNGRDQASVTQNPTRASGTIDVMSRPKIYSPAAISGNVRPGGPSLPATATADENCQRSGTLRIATADGINAQLSQGQTLLGSAAFSESQIVFPGFLTLDVSGPVVAGNSWDIDVVAKSEADTLTIGRIIYVFTDSPTLSNHIGRGANNIDTANNIAGTIDDHSDVSAQVNGNRVNVEAEVAGRVGNNIVLETSNSSALVITAMSGGRDREASVTIDDKKDQPMNAVIQINFNEAVLPITVSGNADDVSDYIRVIDLAAPSNHLGGKFIISNGYKTVEFLSDNQCGVNSCGEPIYCLPAFSNLRVELVAANLIICADNTDCAAKSPYNNCNTICQNSDGQNYPTADIGAMDGVMDTAFNSLDGNRDDDADGPISFYNENSPNIAEGDNFVWSFFINDQLDTTPPMIETTAPAIGGYNNLIDPLEIDFNKIIMSGSLSTGEVEVDSGQGKVAHKALNIWSLAGRAVGYWVIKEDLDIDLDGQTDKTRALINHNMLFEGMSFRAQVGSAVRDIYQNCFKPSAGPACVGVDQANPSCCNGQVTATLNADGNCP